MARVLRKNRNKQNCKVCEQKQYFGPENEGQTKEKMSGVRCRVHGPPRCLKLVNATSY